MKIKVSKHKLNIPYRGSPWGSRTQQHAYCLPYAHSHHIESHLGKKQPQAKIPITFLFSQLHFNNVAAHALFYGGRLRFCAVQNQGITLKERVTKTSDHDFSSNTIDRLLNNYFSQNPGFARRKTSGPTWDSREIEFLPSLTLCSHPPPRFRLSTTKQRIITDNKFYWTSTINDYYIIFPSANSLLKNKVGGIKNNEDNTQTTILINREKITHIKPSILSKKRLRRKTKIMHKTWVLSWLFSFFKFAIGSGII